MDLTAQRHDVARSLTALEASLERLTAALAHGDLWIEIEDRAPATLTPIRRACEAYSAIDYAMDDDVGDSVTCLGAIGIRAETLRLAEAVNAAKSEFKAICAPLYRMRTRIPVKGEASPTRAIPVIRVILRSIQRSDVNLLAAYRKIPILAATPATITFTRATTRAVYRKTIEDIETLLLNREGPKAMADRARLAALPRRETHLALAKRHYANTRANIRYAHLDPRGRGRVQVAAELPLLYPKGRRTTPPDVRFPPRAHDDQPSDASPKRERQSKLEPQPFLESLPVYRYTRSQ